MGLLWKWTWLLDIEGAYGFHLKSLIMGSMLKKKWTWLLDIEGLMLLFAISILFSFLGFINTLSYKRVASHYRYLLLLKKSIASHNTIHALRYGFPKQWYVYVFVSVCFCEYIYIQCCLMRVH